MFMAMILLLGGPDAMLLVWYVLIAVAWVYMFPRIRDRGIAAFWPRRETWVAFQERLLKKFGPVYPLCRADKKEVSGFLDVMGFEEKHLVPYEPPSEA